MILTDPNSLIAGANQYQLIRPRWTQELVIVWLLGQWANSPALQTAPVLTAVGGKTTTWTYSGTNPNYWSLYTSTNGGLSWIFSQSVAGTLRTMTGTKQGDLAYLQGTADAFGATLVTDPSNTVTIT